MQGNNMFGVESQHLDHGSSPFEGMGYIYILDKS